MTAELPRSRVWRLSDVGGPEWIAWKRAPLDAERAERAAELERAIRRRDVAARKVVRLEARIAELDASVATLLAEARP